MSNVVELWLELVGTVERAEKLLALYNGPGWNECPSRALFGAAGSDRLYVNPRYTPALDAWDTGGVTRRDIIAWAQHVARGDYHGPVHVTS